MNTVEDERVVQILPPHLRPKYETRRDLRLMTRAFRNGWVIGVPVERQQEWFDDVCEMMKGNESVDDLLAAIKLVRAARELNSHHILDGCCRL